MQCPQCKKGEVKEQISFKGFFIKKKEIYYYCPLCEWENKKVFKLSQQDLELEKVDRLNKPKENIQRYYTERKLFNDEN
jgi:hypothetical protein